ncbi:MAG: hypothetical protein ACLP5V_07895 [Candidatus Bathyarchaeia archaeon]
MRAKFVFALAAMLSLSLRLVATLGTVRMPNYALFLMTVFTIGVVTSNEASPPKDVEEDPPIRHVIAFFLARPFYVRMRKIEAHSEVETPQADWILWELKPDINYPPMLVYDDEKRVSASKLEYSLEPINDKAMLAKINASLPEEKLKQVEKLWLQWPGTTYPYYRSVPRLRSPEVLRDMDWADFVDNHVVAFLHDGKEEKDPRLALVQKSTILEGLDPYTAPHSIQCTNSGVGKTEFYTHLGIDFGKVTTNSFLGYAKSPSEVYPGLINGKTLPVGIDQIESQSAQKIMSFMFNALEKGSDYVASGGVIFKIEMWSTVSLLANPTSVGERVEPAKSFRYLLYHLSINSALGRRFGWVFYATDIKRILHKPSPKALAAWDEDIKLFRAVEEYCHDKLLKIVTGQKIRSWLNTSIRDYAQQIELSANTIADSNVRQFLNEHGMGAQARVRGAALYATLVDLLREIALGEATEGMILEHADDLLSEVVNLNVQSIRNIATNWTTENADYAESYFKNLPTYLREILSAIELWHRAHPESGEVGIAQIPYQPSDLTYTHLSKCLNRLTKRKPRGLGGVILEIEHHYHYQLQERDGNWEVTFLDPKPNTAIEPIGKLIDVSPFSPSSPILQSTREKSSESVSKLADSDNAPLRNDGETVKPEKSEKTNADGNLDKLIQGHKASLFSLEEREAATFYLINRCKDSADPAAELVNAGYTKDHAQAEKFVQELRERGLLGGGH